MRVVIIDWRAIALLCIGVGLTFCSGSAQQGAAGSTAAGAGSAGAATKGADATPATAPGRIEGEIERNQVRARMRIWGQVERLRSGAHGQLPPLTAKPSGGDGDPVTRIRNQTSFKLTIWFAGKCSHQVEVPPDTDVTAMFCAGRYNLAAMVDDRAFLPLVREDQDFEKGVEYRLDFFVKKSPR